jgi:hypothetical protein
MKRLPYDVEFGIVKMRQSNIATIEQAEIYKSQAMKYYSLAEFFYRSWESKLISIAKYEMMEKFGLNWDGMRGFIHFIDEDVEVVVRDVFSLGWRFVEDGPQVAFYEILKSGKIGKTKRLISVNYILNHFTLKGITHE